VQSGDNRLQAGDTVTRPSRVLVAYASRMGSTAEIAAAVAERLEAAGFDVDLVETKRAPSPESYSAVVVGSAIYVERWMKTARDFLRNNADDLSKIPTWLFESGPCGELALQRHTVSRGILRLAERIGASSPHVFGGNLDPARATSRLTRWVANSDLAGDYRDWTAIRTWADGIAQHLLSAEAGTRRQDQPPSAS
jgi:menaquinone-dependent protoporphyrinogen oxidase